MQRYFYVEFFESALNLREKLHMRIIFVALVVFVRLL